MASLAVRELRESWTPEITPTPELDHILHPQARGSFLREYLGQRYLHVPGYTGKFTHLFSWPVLNDILRYHRLSHPQLRMVKEGKLIPSDQILSRTGTLSVPDLTRQLREGATLIVDRIDELWEPVATLAMELERLLRAQITVNLYAGWKAAPGFDMHWDDHDVLVLQVAGQKHWRIYGETERFPVARTPLNCLKPRNEPLWEGILTEGDALYLPRGWWHVANSCAGPTVHLTVGIHNPTALDLLRWLADRLSRHECLRMDIPRFASKQAQDLYLRSVQEAITSECRQESLVSEFLRHLDETAPARAAAGLPWSAAPQVLPDDQGLNIQVQLPRGLEAHLYVSDSSIEIRSAGKVCRFEKSTAPLFDRLRTHGCIPLAEFYGTFAGRFSHCQLQDFVASLAREGIVALS